VTNEVQWVNRFVCYLTAGQRNRRADVWQTTAISLPRVTCDEEPFQCVNRQIAGALHFKLMHSTVPSMGPPYHAGRRMHFLARLNLKGPPARGFRPKCFNYSRYKSVGNVKSAGQRLKNEKWRGCGVPAPSPPSRA